MTRPSRTLLRVAALLGVLCGGAYLALAPVPTQRELVQRPAWRDYRDRAFRKLEDSIPRDDPAMLVRGAVASIQRRDFKRFLAHCGERIQRRHTPDTLAARFDENTFPNVARIAGFLDPVPLDDGRLVYDVLFQHRERVVAYRYFVRHDPDRPHVWRVDLMRAELRRAGDEDEDPRSRP